jgi:hypothetical protein
MQQDATIQYFKKMEFIRKMYLKHEVRLLQELEKLIYHIILMLNYRANGKRHVKGMGVVKGVGRMFKGKWKT